MNTKEATDFVAGLMTAAGLKPTIDRSHGTTVSARVVRKGQREAPHGRSICVEIVDYNDTYYRRERDGRVRRVVMRAGRIGQNRYARDVTRTFPVRNDGTLNGPGIKDALRQLAETIRNDHQKKLELADHAALWRDGKLELVEELKALGVEFSPDRRCEYDGRADSRLGELRVVVESPELVRVDLPRLSVHSVEILLQALQLRQPVADKD